MRAMMSAAAIPLPRQHDDLLQRQRGSRLRQSRFELLGTDALDLRRRHRRVGAAREDQGQYTKEPDAKAGQHGDGADVTV